MTRGGGPQHHRAIADAPPGIMLPHLTRQNISLTACIAACFPRVSQNQSQAKNRAATRPCEGVKKQQTTEVGTPTTTQRANKAEIDTGLFKRHGWRVAGIRGASAADKKIFPLQARRRRRVLLGLFLLLCLGNAFLQPPDKNLPMFSMRPTPRPAPTNYKWAW